MRWITAGALQREFGLRWQDAEQIISTQCHLKRVRGWSGLLHMLLWFACLFWVMGGARSCFPHATHGQLSGLELLALPIMIVLLVLPRLLAAEAILAQARAAAPH